MECLLVFSHNHVYNSIPVFVLYFIIIVAIHSWDLKYEKSLRSLMPRSTRVHTYGNVTPSSYARAENLQYCPVAKISAT
jgi:hypothetical protein